jgi:hypothetical protein
METIKSDKEKNGQKPKKKIKRKKGKGTKMEG